VGHQVQGEDLIILYNFEAARKMGFLVHDAGDVLASDGPQL
jgi:hypothetical protein